MSNSRITIVSRYDEKYAISSLHAQPKNHAIDSNTIDNYRCCLNFNCKCDVRSSDVRVNVINTALIRENFTSDSQTLIARGETENLRKKANDSSQYFGLPVTDNPAVLRKLSHFKRVRFQKSRIGESSSLSSTPSSSRRSSLTLSLQNKKKQKKSTDELSQKNTKSVVSGSSFCIDLNKVNSRTTESLDEIVDDSNGRTIDDSNDNLISSCGDSFVARDERDIGDDDANLLIKRLDHLGSFAYVSSTSGNKNFNRTTAHDSNVRAKEKSVNVATNNDNDVSDTRDLSVSSGEVSSSSTDIIDQKSRVVDKTVIILPPNEYCSTVMLNQARYGRDIKDSITDKGGTMKNILQSNKSFIHYLTTYPLKNTFRGYIQLGPYLEGRCIALPRHHAFEIFSIDVCRDARFLHAKPSRCNDCVERDALLSLGNGNGGGRCLECPYWPDERLEFFFDTTINFTLCLKRDPAIHNGSIVFVERVFVFAEFTDFTDSIYVSSFILKNLNGDFDGDAVTVNIIRGLESVLDVELHMGSSRFFLGVGNKRRGDSSNVTKNYRRDDNSDSFDRKIRYTFSQSLIFRIFTRLTFDANEDPNDVMEPLIKSIYARNVDDETRSKLYDAVKFLLMDRLNVWKNSNAAKRALALFGPFYNVYVEALRNVYRNNVSNGNKNNNDVDDKRMDFFNDYAYENYKTREDNTNVESSPEKTTAIFTNNSDIDNFWKLPIWNAGFLDHVWMLAVNSSNDNDVSDIFMKRLLRICRSYSSHPHLRFSNDDEDFYSGIRRTRISSDYPLMSDKILCAYNWLVVYSGAKATPRELVALYERCRDYRNSHIDSNNVKIDRYDDGDGDNDDICCVDTNNIYDTCRTKYVNDSSINDSKVSNNSNSKNHKISEYEDLYRECDYSKIQDYKNYMDNFVLVSKNVPRSSYFATGLKWIAQVCSIDNGNFYMNKNSILNNIGFYLKDINNRIDV